MNIQNILWPQNGVCAETKLYFRADRELSVDEEMALPLAKGTKVQFDTYFNGLTIDKWKKYTNLKHVSLKLSVKGKAKITIFSKELVHAKIKTSVFQELTTDSESIRELSLQYPDSARGMLAFRIESLGDGGACYGGYYDAEVKPPYLRNVKLGIVICTYRREDFVEKNLELLNSYILENKNSPLKDKAEVFISDNGQTLDAERLQSESIHIFKNKNTGGAGGFTRGLIEITNHNPSAGITHALLMDDDVIIEPESLVKTYNILTLLKEEYIDAFIGGAMLRNDQQHIQVESGAMWNEGKFISLKQNLDLNSSRNCLYNEIEEHPDFNAWWYCCFPVTIAKRDNLPIPIFIRGDDSEYGLRNMKSLILMNGIAVWHEPFENKYSSFLSYYSYRNRLIDNSLHCPKYTKKKMLRDFIKLVFKELLLYRYENVDLIIRGVEDYLKGIDWLIHTDGEALHREIMAAGYKGLPVGQLNMPFDSLLYEQSFGERKRGFKRYLRYVTANGYLLPANRDVIASMGLICVHNAYRARRIMNYDPTTGKAFVTVKSYGDLFRRLAALCGTIRIINRDYDKISKEFRARKKEVQSIDFWRRYLNLERLRQ